jgi:flagellar biosynthesis chaperone FliJ
VIVDLRRFDYALEPLRKRRRWQLDALEARLGRVEREVQQAMEELEVLRARHREESEQAAQRLSGAIDLEGYARVLTWLADRVRAIHAQQERLEELRRERIRVRAKCLAQQQKVDVIERHRADCLAEFSIEEQNRQSSEADREWLVRRTWSETRGDVSRGSQGEETP